MYFFLSSFPTDEKTTGGKNAQGPYQRQHRAAEETAAERVQGAPPQLQAGES